MTNAGLSITLPLIHTINGYIGILSAARPGDHGNVGVFMRRDDTGQMSRIVSPPMPLRVCLHPSRFDLTSIHVKAVDRRQKVPHRLPTYSPSRSGNGLVVSLRKNMERHVPSFFSFPAESLQSQAPESAATLVFPSADDLPEFYARDEASDVRAITTGIILGATPLKPDVVMLSASFCLVLTRTAICDLKTGRVDYRYTAVRLGHYPRSRTLWLALVCSQETKLAVSDIVQERNAWFLSRYVRAMEYTSRSSAWEYLGHHPHQEGGCHEYVEFGCCDMGHPDFDQLRLVHIGWPPASDTSAAARALFRKT